MFKKNICKNTCKYWNVAFEHNEKACVLSDVFSVRKGCPCSYYENKNNGNAIKLVEKINSGFKPIVEINDNILSEQYLKSGMKAQVVSANHIISESGDYIIFLLDYSDFDIHNSSLKNLGLHSHMSIDVDEKSDSLKEEVFYYFDTQNNIPFDIV